MQYLIHYNKTTTQLDYTHDAALLLEMAGADQVKAAKALRAARETGCVMRCMIARGDGIAWIAARVTA